MDNGQWATGKAFCQESILLFHAAPTSLGHVFFWTSGYSLFSSRYTTLCPNGTVFNQELFICDWWYKVKIKSAKQPDWADETSPSCQTQVDCSLAESFYNLNDNIEAFADVHELEIEKPFRETSVQTAKESFSSAVQDNLLDEIICC